jgi:DNA polymerase-3 subunit beta
LLEAVRLISVFSTESSTVIKFKINNEGSIKVSATAQEAGDHQSDIPALIDGEGLDMSFNSRFLLEFLNNIKSEKVLMKISGAVSPCIFIPSNEIAYLHLIMPVQLQ